MVLSSGSSRFASACTRGGAAGEDPIGGMADLRDLGTEVEVALDELRSIGRGAFPTPLVDRGLVAAVQSLAAQRPHCPSVSTPGRPAATGRARERGLFLHAPRRSRTPSSTRPARPPSSSRWHRQATTFASRSATTAPASRWQRATAMGCATCMTASRASGGASAWRRHRVRTSVIAVIPLPIRERAAPTGVSHAAGPTQA